MNHQTAIVNVVINAEITQRPENSVFLENQGNFFRHLLTALNYPTDNPPMADLLCRYHDLEGEWAVVSPIQWMATHNDAMIVACDKHLQFSEQISYRWFLDFTEFVVEEKMTLHYHDAVTWLLRIDGKPPICAQPVEKLLNQSWMSHIRAMDPTGFWQRFITASQMFFHRYPFNQEPTFGSINGVWLWGNGAKLRRSCLPLFCDAPLFAIAQQVSNNVQLYQETTRFPKNSIVLLQNDDIEDLQRLLRHRKVRWDWNNGAYIIKPERWWMGLIRGKRRC